MDEARINQLVDSYGFAESPQRELVVRICLEVERETRQDFYDLIQVANGIASRRVMTGRELDIAAFKKEQSDRSGGGL